LSVREGDSTLLVRCFAGCNARDVLDELRCRHLLDDDGRGRQAAASHETGSLPPAEPEPNPEALAIWRDAQPIAGTLGERYLREHRGIGCELPPTLRFFPDAVYPRTGHRFPAIVAAVQRPDRAICAVQLTYLRPSDGAKAPLSTPRLTVGKLGKGAIRLAAADEVLGLAEGTESALSAQELTGVPCWATLGGQRLARIGLPTVVGELHIFADDDPAGRLAAEIAAGAYTRAGMRVTLRWPPDGFNDWNDYLRRKRASTEMEAA
jgi:hypothetical protein